MDGTTKITRLEIENVKRVRAVALEPSQSGLTIIGGRNNQGKTSVLDAIAWALGGDKLRPTQACRDGSNIPPRLRVELSSGLIVERSGKNSSLKVTDPSGRKGGQQLLNEVVEQLALDLPKFMQANDKQKASTLLQTLGIGDQLYELDQQEQELFNRRKAIGQIADQKAKYAKELPFYENTPEEPIAISDLIAQQQEILAKNGENQRRREMRNRLQEEYDSVQEQLKNLLRKSEELREQLEIASKTASELQDESTAELEENIRDVEAINARVRSNLTRVKAMDEAQQYMAQRDALTTELEHTRASRLALLDSAVLPLPGLSVEDNNLIYNGQRWDNMSGSDQLKVATAIVRKLNPRCGFVLLDKLEQMDLDTLHEFAAWLESEGLQAIATRVSTGDECSIIIEDGTAVVPTQATPKKTWKEGAF